MKEEQFINNLRTELHATQSSRNQYIRQKFTFVTTLLGVGTISVVTESQKIQTANLLYLVPIIAVAFDLYILGEDFSVKRIGAFLGRHNSNTCDEEKKWETYVSGNRDMFSVFAGPLMSTLILLVSAYLIWHHHHPGIPYYIWLIFVVLSLTSIHIHGYRLRATLKKYFATGSESGIPC